MCGEEALEEYLDRGQVSPSTIAALIAQRKLFPCWFGSALKVDGVDELLAGLEEYTLSPPAAQDFGAKVFKISRDSQGVRLTWLKVTGGSLKAKSLLSGGQGEAAWEEKADQLRLYSGEKFRPLDQAEAGTVCAVTGLTHTQPGQGLGSQADSISRCMQLCTRVGSTVGKKR